jgi:putative ABC transport system substrate-binding protein
MAHLRPTDRICETNTVRGRRSARGQGDRMIRRRRLLIALGTGIVGAPRMVFAQEQSKVRRIGYLAARSRSTPSNPDVYYDAFVQGMRELGYVEGKNLVIEWRFADGRYDLLPALAAELVRMNVEIIVTHSTPATEALHRATKTTPIVTYVVDPVQSGFAVSLARPGGNVTGLSSMSVDVSVKQVELLKTMIPSLSRVAVLVNPGSPASSAILEGVQAAGQHVGIKVLPMYARTPEDVERAVDKVKREHAGALIVATDSFFILHGRQIAELATKNRIPSMFMYRKDVAAGGLISYGLDFVEQYRRTATYVDKILKGAKPAELPIEQPTKIHLAINRKTAKLLGLAIPQELLLRADEVIE